MNLRQIERVYSDPSAAQERAMIWQRLGIAGITITPVPGGLYGPCYVLTGQATAAQVARL